MIKFALVAIQTVAVVAVMAGVFLSFSLGGALLINGVLALVLSVATEAIKLRRDQGSRRARPTGGSH